MNFALYFEFTVKNKGRRFRKNNIWGKVLKAWGRGDLPPTRFPLPTILNGTAPRRDRRVAKPYKPTMMQYGFHLKRHNTEYQSVLYIQYKRTVIISSNN